jgi:SAM-dependent methyltransferase
VLAVIELHLRKLSETISGLQTTAGIAMDAAEVTVWTEMCFEYGSSRYDAVDSNVPSGYYERYPTYLTSHEKMLERAEGLDGGTRILIASPDELRSDRTKNPAQYREFLNWHEFHGVALEYVAPETAQRLQRKHSIPTTDVGIWHEQYALTFAPGRNGEIIMSMRFLGDQEFTRYEEYLASIRAEARPVDEDVPLFPKAMAEAWSDYVDAPRRLATLGPFLTQILAEFGSRARILDAAAGIGTDSLWLLQNGFTDVTSNEIEPAFESLMLENFRAAGYSGPQTLHTDWRELSLHYPAPVFDVVLVLGNSLCLVDDTADQHACLEQFYSVLRPGGMFVVDERNWEYLMREREAIQRDPIANFTSPRVMYCGELVRSYPKPISDHTVTLTFYRNSGREPLDLSANEVGKIEIFPILNPRLPELLAQCGFVDIETFSDLVRGGSEDATFFTYVARKPPDSPTA